VNKDPFTVIQNFRYHRPYADVMHAVFYRSLSQNVKVKKILKSVYIYQSHRLLWYQVAVLWPTSSTCRLL